ncbi:MAG: hypothetical protein RBS99_19365, partial [Rhodospirillales bacterium]|nr:hypothetical protein [Rhodospirillales bacterium]
MSRTTGRSVDRRLLGAVAMATAMAMLALGGAAQAALVTISDAQSGTTLSVTNGDTYDVIGGGSLTYTNYNVGYNSAGTMTVNGGVVTANSGGAFYVGRNAGGDGVLTLNSGSVNAESTLTI